MVAALQDFDTDKTATQSIAFFRNPCYSASPIGLSELYFRTLDVVHFKIEAYSDKMSLEFAYSTLGSCPTNIWLSCLNYVFCVVCLKPLQHIH